MVDVTLDGKTVVFNVLGLHKLWAFKGRLEIPQKHIKGARKDPDLKKQIEKLGGKPGAVTAGTFVKEEEKVFWDVRDPEKAVVIDLADEEYNQLVIEVEYPEEVIRFIQDIVEGNTDQVSGQELYDDTETRSFNFIDSGMPKDKGMGMR